MHYYSTEINIYKSKINVTHSELNRSQEMRCINIKTLKKLDEKYLKKCLVLIFFLCYYKAVLIDIGQMIWI